MKKNNIELTVKEASELIGVTPRSIINYIKAKEIKAIKVGKSWYIKEPSLIAFAKKYGLENVEKNIEVETDKQVSTQTQIDDGQEPLKIKPAIIKKKSSKKYIINTLKLYEISHKAFEMPMWQELSTAANPSFIMKRIAQLKIESIELIGAGYFSFEKREKRNLYARSREKVGAIIALFYTDPHLKKQWSVEIEFIENQLLAAYSSLIRKMEKRNEKQ